MKCFKCNMDIPDDAKLCPHCGATTSKPEFMIKTVQSLIWGAVSIFVLLFIAKACFTLALS